MAQNYKVPPHNDDAEQGMLGGILLDDEILINIAEIVAPEDFYNPNLGTIFEAMLALFEKQSPIDVLTVSSYLKAKKKFKEIGGEGILSELVSITPTAAHCEEYAKIVKDLSIRRRMISLGSQINELAFSEDRELQMLLDDAERSLFSISNNAVKKDFQHIGFLLEKAYEQAAFMNQNPNAIRGIPSGFTDVDKLLGGFQRSDLIILAARPAVGKTAFSLDVARHVGTVGGLKVGFFSLEMANAQLIDRILSQEMKVGLWELRMGKLNDHQFAQMADIMGKLSEGGLYFDDTPGINIMEMRTKARRLKMEQGLDMIIVDYLQLITGNKSENRTQEVSEISRFLKMLARELEVPLIALSQLSRAVESRADRLPVLSDLRESGSIEQDADIVMFLHRESAFDPDADKSVAELIVAKHRNGATGRIGLKFVPEQARYRDLDTVHQEPHGH